jgi:hypothetical protein
MNLLSGSVVSVSLVAIAISGFVLAQDVGKAKESPEQKAVREYLRENLPTGKFEEVRWYQPTRIKYEGKPGPVAIRLKYRSQNNFGGTSLYDDVFEFVGKRLVHHRPDSVINMNREKIFPSK